MGRDILVVTHTQARHHVEGLVGGWYDSELTSLGHRQAQRLASRIGQLAGDGRPVELYASDLLRTAQTAAPIAARLGVPATYLVDLREQSAGVAGGRPNAWLQAREIPPLRAADRMDHRNGVEGAETRRELFTRIYRAMDQILEGPCATQVVVTHGIALTAVVAAWIRMPLESASWVNFRAGPGGLTHLSQDDHHFDRAVLCLNDRSHLDGVDDSAAQAR